MIGQQDLQKQSLNRMQDMTHRHEYDNLMRHIPRYDGKTWNWQIGYNRLINVALLSNSQEYELATAKLTGTPYNLLKRIGKDTSCQEVKRKLEEVYSPTVMEVHTASNLHRNNDQTKPYKNTYKIVLT